MDKDSVLRNFRHFADSPVPPSHLRTQVQHNGLSPMSGLVQHLGTTSLSPRRLSLSSVASPSPLPLRHKLLQDLNFSGSSDISMTESPTVFKTIPQISSAAMGSPTRCKNKENCSHVPTSPPPHRVSVASPPKLFGTSQFGSSPLKRKRTPFEDHSDSNSQDSGLDSATFRFVEPLGVAPRKPAASPLKEILSPPRESPFFRCLSTGSNDSMDDGFLDFLALEKVEQDTSNMPTGLSSLLSGTIVRNHSPRKSPNSKKPNSAKRSLHRSLSMMDTPTTTRAHSSFFRNPSVDDASARELLGGGFKRPDPPDSDGSETDVPTKRQRKNDEGSTEELGTAKSFFNHRPVLTQSSLFNYGFQRKTPAKPFQRCHSESETTIKRALQRSLTEPDLIGDFSRNFALPLVEGKHPDLKTISCDTMVKLLNGHYDNDVASYQVIDCRYPYEYIGGHILNSRNVYSKELVNEVFVAGRVPVPSDHHRHVLVFHCEFSSERAPSMYRHLRHVDRDANKECYPRLHYPEIYLLHGGYKAFYEMCPHLCEPSGYVPMLNRDNEADLRHFRAKSRSWAGDRNGGAGSNRLPSKFSLKRLDA